MTISSTYRTGGVGVQQRDVRQRLEQARAAAAAALPAAATAAAIPAGGAAAGGGTSLAVIDDAALAASAAPADPAASDTLAMANLVTEMERRGSVHRSTLAAMESTKEWKDYDAHVTFELMLLRHRYQSTDAPMTAARRSQMQAHLRQKQLQVMEEHADRVAKQYVRSLTSGEIEGLKAQFLRLDAAGVALDPTASVPPARVTDEPRREAFAALKASAAAPPPADAGTAAPPPAGGSSGSAAPLKDTGR